MLDWIGLDVSLIAASDSRLRILAVAYSHAANLYFLHEEVSGYPRLPSVHHFTLVPFITQHELQHPSSPLR